MTPTIPNWFWCPKCVEPFHFEGTSWTGNERCPNCNLMCARVKRVEKIRELGARVKQARTTPSKDTYKPQDRRCGRCDHRCHCKADCIQVTTRKRFLFFKVKARCSCGGCRCARAMIEQMGGKPPTWMSE